MTMDAAVEDNSPETCAKRFKPDGEPCVWHERYAAAEALVVRLEAQG